MDRAVLRDKLDNYWYYYKVHTIVAIFAIIVIAYTIATSIGQKGTALNVTILGNYINDTKKIALQDEATKLFVTDPKKEVNLNFYSFDKEGKDPTASVIVQKIMAETQVKDLDILIVDKDLFAAYAEQGMFLRIDTINELPGLKNLKLVNAKVKDVDSQEYAYGIDVSDNEMLKGTDYDTKDKVLGIVANTERRDISVNFLKWMFKL